MSKPDTGVAPGLIVMRDEVSPSMSAAASQQSSCRLNWSPSSVSQPVSLPPLSPVEESHEPRPPAAFPWLPCTLLQINSRGN
ncbi:hypothetical protein JOQ06_029674, partial [Pogonophryne albipinna]